MYRLRIGVNKSGGTIPAGTIVEKDDDLIEKGVMEKVPENEQHKYKVNKKVPFEYPNKKWGVQHTKKESDKHGRST